MELSTYNSIYTGSNIDAALSVIIESGITQEQISVLVDVTAGAATAEKAVILDSNKDIAGLNSVSAKKFTADYLILSDLTADPTSTPEEGTKFLYFKGDTLYFKNEEDEVFEYGITETKEFDFTDATSVVCAHGFDYKYPQTFIVIDDVEDEGEISFTNSSSLTVSFNTAQTGKIIISKV